MALTGSSLLVIALVVALYGVVVSLLGARSGSRSLLISGRRALFVVTALIVAAFGLLELGFLRDDFSLRVVAEHSSTTTTTFYKATAIWSSQEGSLLLWVVLLSLFSTLVVAFGFKRFSVLVPVATAVLLAYCAFFIALMVFLASPFDQLAQIPTEGKGLNPLLRHPSMMFHPPALYSGYTLITIPFAFAIAALVTGRLDSVWLRATRRYTLAGWAALTVGILLGARWSYAELGWGGYWAWDPVENAALMPWLISTAFLHSSLIQEKRDMLKVWNVSLVLAAGILSILGTFLVRSGIISSIHAFGESTLGGPFVVFIASITLFAVVLVLWRRPLLASERRIESWLSREAIFLFNNLLLVALCAVIFWGTFFPLISEAFTGQEASVGPPWFERYVVPLALLLVLLAGVGPAVPWRRATASRLLRTLLIPITIVLVELVLLVVLGITNAAALFAFAACTLAAVVAIQELLRAALARRRATGDSLPAALAGLVSRNRRRYGGYTVHIGIALLFAGVAGSSAFQSVEDVRLKPGESEQVAGLEFRYIKPTLGISNERISFGAVVDVYEGDNRIASMRPDRGFYPSLDVERLGTIGRFFEGEATSEVGLKAGINRDVWAAVQPDISSLQAKIDEADRRFSDANGELQGLIIGSIAQSYVNKPGELQFRFIVSPLVTWIWIGAIVITCGAMIGIWPTRGGGSSRYMRKLASELKES